MIFRDIRDVFMQVLKKLGVIFFLLFSFFIVSIIYYHFLSIDFITF